MPFKWPFADGQMLARLLWYLDPLSPHQLKKLSKLDPPLIKLSGSAHEVEKHVAAVHVILKCIECSRSHNPVNSN